VGGIGCLAWWRPAHDEFVLTPGDEQRLVRVALLMMPYLVVVDRSKVCLEVIRE
jgi:hypothetical protein